MVPSAQQITIDKIEIIPDHSILLALTEGIRSEFKLTITQGDKTIYDKNYPIYLMAYDQWSGSGIRPELLAAFVTPNHPLLSCVSVNASIFLQKWSNSSALDEYQTQNPNRRENAIQTSLFDTIDRSKQTVLIKAIDEINRKNGHDTVKVAIQGTNKRYHLKCEHISRQFTTNLNEILKVRTGWINW